MGLQGYSYLIQVCTQCVPEHLLDIC